MDGVFAKMGSVNSVFMRFSITIFPGRVSDFRLKGESLPPKGLRASDSLYFRYAHLCRYFPVTGAYPELNRGTLT